MSCSRTEMPRADFGYNRRVISRRRLELAILLMLPLMLLRGLLPAGYMVSGQQGELRVVMCADGLQAAPGDHAGTGEGHPDLSGTGDCPFAQATFHAPPVQFVAGVVAPISEIRFISSAAEQLPPATGPPRQRAARAPPALS
jgi:hypothetical protein